MSRKWTKLGRGRRRPLVARRSAPTIAFVNASTDLSAWWASRLKRRYRLGSTNAARTGGGMTASAPLTAFQMISLKSRSSARSSTSRLSRCETAAIGALRVFRAFKSTRAGRWTYGEKSGWRRERLEHRPRGRVELRHRLEAQDQLHRAEHRRRAVQRRIDRVPLDIGADRQGDRPVGVDVVRAVLGVVLDHEDGHLLPEPALGQALDEPPSARSLSPTQAVTVHLPGTSPTCGRWAAGGSTSRGISPAFSNPASSSRNRSVRLTSGIVHVEAAEHRVEVALEWP